MFPQRNTFRFSQRATQQLRTTVQRRFNSTESKFPWAADNEFNRERANVKHHAASTSDLWRKLSLFVVPPCLILAGINSYNLWAEHWEHWEHMPPMEERTEYPYQNLRTKNFPWGDGDKSALWVPPFASIPGPYQTPCVVGCWNSSVNYHNKDKPT